jgi:predicted Zn-dependent protease
MMLSRVNLSLQARLLDSQKQALLGNRVLLLLAAQKLDAAGTAYQALASRFPNYPHLQLLHAALLAQSGKVQP